MSEAEEARQIVAAARADQAERLRLREKAKTASKEDLQALINERLKKR